MTTGTPFQVLICTGQSAPPSTALSPEQHALLDALDLPEEHIVRQNFPYDDPGLAHRPTPILIASARHVVLAVRMRLPGWRTKYRRAVVRQLRAADRTLVLAGSIGLSLLDRLRLPQDVLDRLTVIAYGPVTSRGPRCRTVRIVGRRDLLALPFRRDGDILVTSGHLDYLKSPEFVQLCKSMVAEVRAADPAATRPAGNEEAG